MSGERVEEGVVKHPGGRRPARGGAPREGVIRFEAVHRERLLRMQAVRDALGPLVGWREVLRRLGAVGQDPARYEGAGFGNLSVRIGPPSMPRGQRAFVVTGTQTGGLRQLSIEHLAVVRRWDVAANRVWSEGQELPSSESLTHGAVYDLSPSIRAVFHGHVPALWRRASALRLPVSDPHVEYGTPEMAHEVARLYRETPLPDVGVFAMGGHEDGVVSFGATPDEAGARLVEWLARAFALDAGESARSVPAVGAMAWVRGIGG